MRARLGLVLALLAIVSLAGCSSTSSESVPADLQGRWDAADTRYDGAWIEIGELSLRFGTVEGTVDGYSVIGYSTEQSLDGEVHLVDYEAAEGDPLQLAFFHEGDTIRLRSRAGYTWKRSEP